MFVLQILTDTRNAETGEGTLAYVDRGPTHLTKVEAEGAMRDARRSTGRTYRVAEVGGTYVSSSDPTNFLTAAEMKKRRRA